MEWGSDAIRFRLRTRHHAQLDYGRWRVSLFQEEVADAPISQTSTVGSVVTSFVQNVGKTRQRGVELVLRQKDAWIRGLELSGILVFDARVRYRRDATGARPSASIT